jgi:hypothetical protein
MLRKVLNILPESILGISVRNRVAKLLGVDLGSIVDEPSEEDRDQRTKEIYGDTAGMSASEIIEAGGLKDEEETKKKKGRRNKNIQKRRRGGPVREDKPYMVGEAGPELFIPSNNGKIIDNKSTLSLLENSLDKETFIEISNMNAKLNNKQMNELQKNNMLLESILEKINSGGTVINNKNNSIVNNQNSSGFRDMQLAV